MSLIVREYRNSDFPAVKRIFTNGCKEYSMSCLYFALTQPRNWILFIVGFLLPLLTIGSVLLAILDVVAILVIVWYCGRNFFYSFAKVSLIQDLKDIHKYYIQREGYNFWVVECEGKVVGMVAAVPLYRNGGEKYLELKRMSVDQNQRGKGIAKVLGRTVIDFARKTGCKAVTLSTTTLQTGAVTLYTSMGFRCVRTYGMTKLTDRLSGLVWIELQYDIQSTK